MHPKDPVCIEEAFSLPTYGVKEFGRRTVRPFSAELGWCRTDTGK